MIRLEKVNEVYVRVHGEPAIFQDLFEELSFKVPNARFHPMVKNKLWDGYIRMLNYDTHLTYLGLSDHIYQYCKENSVECAYEKQENTNITPQEFVDFVKSLDLPADRNPRDFQIYSAYTCIKNRRRIFVSPTGSGKSLIIYMMVRYLSSIGIKTIITTESAVLVEQLRSDFESYAPNQMDWCEENIKTMHSDVKDKSVSDEVSVLITTWQSAHRMSSEFLGEFGSIICDEVHTAEAKCLKELLCRLTHVGYRYGCSGTLRDSRSSELQLRGLFGPIFQTSTTAELIERGILPDLKINGIFLKYPPEYCKSANPKKGDFDHDNIKVTPYEYEMGYIDKNEERLEFMANLSSALDGNVLILFKKVDAQANKLEALLKETTDRPVYLVTGKVAAKARILIQEKLKKETNAIVVASYGVFSTGTNVPNIRRVILGSPMKSKIKVLQTIGRGLRKHAGKVRLDVYDIADDFTVGRRRNFALKHFRDRVNLYAQEGFSLDTSEYQMKRGLE